LPNFALLSPFLCLHQKAKGAKNLPELNKLLREHCMIRRLKKDVLKQLLPKTRKAIVTDIHDKKLDKLMVEREGMQKELERCSFA